MDRITAVVVLLAVGALATVTWSLLELLETGTCAMGGPYVVARQCPDGTGVAIAALAGGSVLYVVAILAAALRSFSVGAGLFGLLFTVLGAAFVFAEVSGRFTESPGTGWIVGLVFLPMGPVPLVGALRSVARRERDTGPTPLDGWAAQVQASAAAAARAVPPTRPTDPA